MASDGGISNAMKALPLSQMLIDTAIGIAEAQEQMDKRSIEAMRRNAETGSGIGDKSLLEVGVVPSFYQFSEATINLSFELRTSSETSFGVGVGVEFQAEKSQG